MPFLTPTVPDVEPTEFLRRPFAEQMKALTAFWAQSGFGTQRMVHMIYIVKVAVLYVCGGVLVASLTSEVGSPLEVSSWWNEPIVYQKLVLWTVLLEVFGIAGTWGPLAAHFKPMTGGAAY